MATTNKYKSPGAEALTSAGARAILRRHTFFRQTQHHCTSVVQMPIPKYEDYLGCFEHPSHLYDIGPPEQIAFYSCFINDINDYRFNDHSALRRYKGKELRLPLQLELAADRGEFHAISARLDKVPRPTLVPVIAACVESKGAASVRDADVITRRGALSRCLGCHFVSRFALTRL
jgi:hypothetical protein